jgi:NADPH-dependent glutamate synthase beta subunit-like oxidoreductase
VTKAPKSVAIVGGGPAGKAAARELAHAGISVTIFEKEAEVGGLMRYGYPTYRMPEDVTQRDALRLAEMGITFRTNWELGQDGSLDELVKDFDAVIMAVGAPTPVALDIPGENLPGVWQAIDLLHDLRAGSVTDRGERVVVIGGGDTAMDAATTSALGGAKHVTVAYRGTPELMRALPNEIDRAQQAGVKFAYGKVPERITATGRGLQVTFVDSESLGADTVVIAIGQRPSKLLAALGLAPGDTRATTNRPGVFLAGGAAYGSDRLAPALASGRAAAAAVLNYLA